MKYNFEELINNGGLMEKIAIIILKKNYQKIILDDKSKKVIGKIDADPADQELKPVTKHAPNEWVNDEP